MEHRQLVDRPLLPREEQFSVNWQIEDHLARHGQGVQSLRDESADQLRKRQLRHWSTVLACLNRVGGQYSAQDTPRKAIWAGHEG